MGVEIRQFDRIKEKVEIRLDSRQIAWLVIGCLAIASGVFTAGFYMGQEQAGHRLPAPNEALLATAPTQDDAQTLQNAEIEEAALHYTYDRVLTDPTPPTRVDDPVLEAKARLMVQEGAAAEDEETPRAATALEPGELRPTEAPDPAKPPAEVEAEEGQEDPELEKEEPPFAADLEPAVKVPAVPPRAHSAGIPVEEKPKADKEKKPRYTIQVKAFRKRKEARQFLNALREAGYQPYIMTADIPKKGRFYRVRLGRYDKLEEAEAKQDRFEKAEGFKTILQTM